MTLFDKRFKVINNNFNAGGMGQIFIVQDETQQLQGNLAVKYCKEPNNEEHKTRFKREVRLLQSLQENTKVVPILYSNLEHNPPYFIMPFCENGDLTKIPFEWLRDYNNQENIIYQMIDCIHELHTKNIFHRDIKPQNFLIDNNGYLVISDLGLGLEPDSSTRLTNTSQYWMTEGYYPPEFTSSGFKYTDATSDIFMLGKTIYALFTKNNPTYFSTHPNIHPHLQYVLNKACAPNKQERYKTILEMKQDITTTYDMILQRKSVTANLERQLEAIINNTQFNSLDNIKTFIQNLRYADDKVSFLYQISTPNFFYTLRIFNYKKRFNFYFPYFLIFYTAHITLSHLQRQ